MLRKLWVSGAIIVLALGVALADGSTGIRRWIGLRGELRASQARIGALRRHIAVSEREAKRLRHDDAAIEAAIREDLGLARPGETIVRFPEPSSQRIP